MAEQLNVFKKYMTLRLYNFKIKIRLHGKLLIINVIRLDYRSKGPLGLIVIQYSYM